MRFVLFEPWHKFSLYYLVKLLDNHEFYYVTKNGKFSYGKELPTPSLPNFYPIMETEIKQINPDIKLLMHSGSNINLPEIKEDKYISFQIAGDFRWERYIHNGILETDFLNSVKRISGYLVDCGYKVQYPLHQPEDAFFRPYILEYEKFTIPWVWRTCMKNIPLGLSYYKNAKLVISMRGHGLIIPYGLGTPIISLENQNKQRELMKRLNLDYYNVPISDSKFINKVIDRIEKANRDYNSLKESNTTILENFHKRSEEDFKIIKEKLGW